jgi:hypothetical protein
MHVPGSASPSSGTQRTVTFNSLSFSSISGESTKWQYASPPWISGSSAFLGVKNF